MIIIGVAGGTGSGKTTVVRKIMERLPKGEVGVISQDSYYKDSSHVPVEERQKINFDEPNAFDWELLLEHLQKLKKGQAVEMPTYSYLTCTRQAETEHMDPHDVVLVEGILVLTDRRLRNMMDIKVFVDASHLEIILRNIISNAVKFTQRGGHVVVRASVYSKHAAVSVDDDGMGMSQEDVARFNKEQDLVPNAGTNNEHGNGIGLAICRDLVRNNGGSIVVEPGRLCGTSVTVLLNLADAGNK